MDIREYQTADHDQVVGLWKAVFPNSVGHNEPSAAIQRKVDADDHLFFVATENDSIIGTVIAGYDGHRGWIYSVSVSPGSRRRGIGTRLIRHAEDALLQFGCPKINLQIRSDNQDVVAFYESIGFQTEARISMGKLIDR